MLNRLIESTGIPVKANIRLGTRVNGKLQNEAFFILSEAPEVKEVYGEQPEFLEVMFPGDDLEAVAPSAFECWSGTRDKEGKIMDGALVCSGPGPKEDGRPGVAIWKDRNRMPPESEIISGRDPRTGYVQRACLAEQCSDWLDQKGYPKCKQTMRLYFIIPRVSPTNVYRITTHSWNSMYEYYRLLDWVRKTEGLAFKPFRIFKEAKSVKHWDSAKGKEFSRSMPILRIEKDDMFMRLYGTQLNEQLKAIRDSRFYLMAPPEPEPMLLDSESYVAPEKVEETPLQRALRIATPLVTDPEVVEAFEKLEAVMNRGYDEKSRLSYIMKKFEEPDVKLAVLDGLTRSALEILSRTNAAIPFAPLEVSAEVPVTAQEMLEKMDPLPVQEEVVVAST